MAQYGTEITNYYAPYRYQGPPSIVGGSGSGGKKKGAAYLAPGRRQPGGDMLQPNAGQQASFRQRGGDGDSGGRGSR